MKRRVALVPVLCLAVLPACGGGGNNSPEDQVRATAKNAAQALASDHPERACRYYADRDTCAGGAVLANSMHVDVGSLVPADWKARLAKAKVTIKGGGDTATLSGFKPSAYVLRDGRWLVDNRE